MQVATLLAVSPLKRCLKQLTGVGPELDAVEADPSQCLMITTTTQHSHVLYKSQVT